MHFDVSLLHGKPDYRHSKLNLFPSYAGATLIHMLSVDSVVVHIHGRR